MDAAEIRDAVRAADDSTDDPDAAHVSTDGPELASLEEERGSPSVADSSRVVQEALQAARAASLASAAACEAALALLAMPLTPTPELHADEDPERCQHPHLMPLVGMGGHTAFLCSDCGAMVE